MMKNRMKLIFKIVFSEWPFFARYLLILTLFYFICLLYKIDLYVVNDLARYTVIPVVMIIIVHVYRKYTDVKAINILIKDGNFKRFHPHGFYGQLYNKALRKFMNHTVTENRNLMTALKNREDYLILWSHEMKTPLTSLLMIAENNSTVGSEEVTEKIDLVNYQLKQLLTFDRLDSFNHDLNFEEIDLADCLKKVIQQNTSFFLSHQVIPRMQIPSVNIVTDSKWLTVILEQIIVNAVKYSNKNGVVQISFNNDTMTITDHGIGITKNDLPRVFEQGFTGGNGRTHGEATGMGLYMVQKIAEILDIKVSIASAENVGTSVKLIFNSKKFTTI